MTKADALWNTLEALRVSRMIHEQAPGEIVLHCDGDATFVAVPAGWSKSATHNRTRSVFLILPQSSAIESALPLTTRIQYGEAEFDVTDCKPPEEPGSYWTLAIKE